MTAAPKKKRTARTRPAPSTGRTLLLWLAIIGLIISIGAVKALITTSAATIMCNVLPCADNPWVGVAAVTLALAAAIATLIALLKGIFMIRDHDRRGWIAVSSSVLIAAAMAGVLIASW